MRELTDTERAEMIERYKDAPMIANVRPCIDDEGWEWTAGGPFMRRSGYCTREEDARRLCEEARKEIEADPAAYNPPVLYDDSDD